MVASCPSAVSRRRLLAALRGGIKKVLIPEENAKDLADHPRQREERARNHSRQPCGAKCCAMRWLRMPRPSNGSSHGCAGSKPDDASQTLLAH